MNDAIPTRDDEKRIVGLRTLHARYAEMNVGHVPITLDELGALLAAVDERDALRRERVEMPDERPPIDGLSITREALRDAEPEAIIAVVRDAIRRVDEACAHEAWEEYGSGRRCADCKQWLGPHVIERHDFVMPVSGLATCGRAYNHPAHPSGRDGECDGIPE